jgi:hypothetical protein
MCLITFPCPTTDVDISGKIEMYSPVDVGEIIDQLHRHPLQRGCLSLA